MLPTLQSKISSEAASQHPYRRFLLHFRYFKSYRSVFGIDAHSPSIVCPWASASAACWMDFVVLHCLDVGYSTHDDDNAQNKFIDAWMHMDEWASQTAFQG